MGLTKASGQIHFELPPSPLPPTNKKIWNKKDNMEKMSNICWHFTLLIYLIIYYNLLDKIILVYTSFDEGSLYIWLINTQQANVKHWLLSHISWFSQRRRITYSLGLNRIPKWPQQKKEKTRGKTTLQWWKLLGWFVCNHMIY